MTDLDQLEFWTKPGVLGFYECCEVTICCMIDRDNTTFNLFTILSFESSKMESRRKPIFRTKRNEWLSKNAHLAIVQYQVTIEEAKNILEQLCNNTTQIKTPLGLLIVGELIREPNAFVPVDSTVRIPLNRIIKNNFVGGSMVAEWHGKDNHATDILTDKERQQTVQRILEILPIDLKTISDRIGNVIVQFPSQIAHCNLFGREEMVFCEVVFNERSKDLQRYVIHAYTDYDGVLIYPSSGIKVSSHKMLILLKRTGGPYCISVLDIQNNIPILAQTTSMMDKIGTNIQLSSDIDSIRTIRLSKECETRIVVNTNHSVLVEHKSELWRDRIERRRYQERISVLNRTKEFIRYSGKNCASERQKALEDLRFLMNVSGNKRVCLWDPYLSAYDLLETWYHTTGYGLELRAITSSEIAKRKKLSVPKWIEEQRRILLDSSNQYGINLNWRIQHSSFGFAFHDRFLIVLDSNESPSAWSLGTSINSVGKKHHVLQAVANPGYIVDDFEELWKQLSDESCQIWTRRLIRHE
jgi:hypothetical protein